MSRINYTPMRQTPQFHLQLMSSPVARRSCSAASVTAMRGKLVTFRDLQKGLQVAKQEFERATKWEDTINAGLMVTRWVRASCDAFLGMTAAAVDSIDPTGKLSAAGKVNAVYKLSVTVAEGATGHHRSRGVFLRDLKDGMVGVGAEFMQGLNKKTGINPKRLTELANLETNIMMDMANRDQERLQREAVVGHVKLKLGMVRDFAEQSGKASAATAARGLGTAVEILSLADKFERDLEKAGDEYLKEAADIERRRHSIRTTLNTQLTQMNAKIAQLKADIDSCYVAP